MQNLKKLPPLNWLRSFESAARLQSFTLAAEELHMTQGAISQHIRSLESHFKTSLFIRHARKIELTEEGLSYLTVVQAAIQRLEVATNEIFGEGHRRQIKIKGSIAFFTYWLNARRLGEFSQENPDINLQFNTDIWMREEDIKADMEIRWGKGQWAGVNAVRLSYDTLFPVCSPRLADSLPLQQVSDLKHHHLLHVMGYQEGWGEWLKFAGATDINASEGVQFDTYACVLNLVESGFGVALGRLSLVEDQLHTGKLIAPFSARLQSSEDFYLIYPQTGFTNPYARRFAEWLVKHAVGGKLTE
ncbi:LysR substrate-binding domain-containing protein [Pantoea cypripedii]|uniref:LysR family transcriptional regulator n=1 Tax=Pantoea cypripedii TaxID=55209 RepID=A0A1X1ELR5_PANCY|nr:LysR substrate-binding domain-containing protein [Pantoea cypripedii]ORM89888.1 LysR family transcriptional regulator [Pantoea cypripedii]